MRPRAVRAGYETWTGNPSGDVPVVSSVLTDVPAGHIVQDLLPSVPTRQPPDAAAVPTLPFQSRIAFAVHVFFHIRPSFARSAANVSIVGPKDPQASLLFRSRRGLVYPNRNLSLFRRRFGDVAAV